MTHDRCLWALGTAFVLAVTLIAVALFYLPLLSRINSVAVLPFVNGSSDVSWGLGCHLKILATRGKANSGTRRVEIGKVT
jgi:hypothetical protein